VHHKKHKLHALQFTAYKNRAVHILGAVYVREMEDNLHKMLRGIYKITARFQAGEFDCTSASETNIVSFLHTNVRADMSARVVAG